MSETNYNWPTLDKLIGDARQVGASWVTGEGHVYLDGFTDVGASPIPNVIMAQWMAEGFKRGCYPRRPHAYFDLMRDQDYPRLLGEHLGLDDEISVFYSSSGTEAIEAALKLVRRATGRPYVLGIVGDFHGRTLGALPLHYDIENHSHPAYHFAGFGPFNPATFAVSESNCYTIPTDEIAALVISPIQGNNTLEDTPDWVWEFAANIRERHGLIVFDEVQTGFGRAGGVVSVTESDEWAIRSLGDTARVRMEPDVYCFGKACGAGWPMAVTACSVELASEMGRGSHFNTMSGSPLGCYLSTRLIEWLEDGLLDTMLRRAERLEAEFAPRLLRRGYMMALQSNAPYALCETARKHGLLLMTARDNKPVRLSPPFYMDAGEDARLKLILRKLMEESD